MIVTEAFRTAAHFLYKNLTVRDPRATSRHNWRWLFYVAMDIAVSRAPSLKAQSGTAVILVNKLGDALVSFPLIKALHEDAKRRGERFLVVGDESWRVLGKNVYRDIPTKFIDERRFRLDGLYRLKTSVWLRSQNFRSALCFMHHRLEMRDDPLVYVTGAASKTVSGLPFYEYRWYPWLFDAYLKQMSRITPVMGSEDSSADRPEIAGTFQRTVPHAFDRLRHFYRELGGAGELEPRTLPAYATEARFSSDTVILNPGASNRERVWPLSEWVALAYQIAESGRPVCITGGPAEATLAPELRQLIEEGKKTHGAVHAEKISVAINELPFESLIGLFQKAACYIGPDTGGSHLAYWAGAPTITILHQDPKLEAYHRLGDFFPYPADVLQTPYRCVWATLDEFHLQNGSAGVRHKVWAAFEDLMTQQGKTAEEPLIPAGDRVPTMKAAKDATV